MRKRIRRPDDLVWKSKREPVPVEEQFTSPVVARAMAQIAQENENLRKWREKRRGKQIEYKPINLHF